MFEESCMKKLGILCALLILAGIAASAQEVAPVDLFSDVDAFALSGEEMLAVIGGQQPDMGGNLSMYSSHAKVEVKDSASIPTKKQLKESLKDSVDVVLDFPKTMVQLVVEGVKEVIRYGAKKIIDRW